MRRPKFLRNYTPPSLDEMSAALPNTHPAQLARYHDLMCLAMRMKTYDRSEAFVRLRGMAEQRKLTELVMGQLRAEAEALACLTRYDHQYALWNQGVRLTWDGQIVPDERAELAR